MISERLMDSLYDDVPADQTTAEPVDAVAAKIIAGLSALIEKEE